jgi:hypothetical protein
MARAFAAASILTLSPAAPLASSDAGIEIELGKFSLKVIYSVALDYRDGADRAIRDPRMARSPNR